MLFEGSATKAILLTVFATSAFAGGAKLYSQVDQVVHTKTRISALAHIDLKTPTFDHKIAKLIKVPAIAQIKIVQPKITIPDPVTDQYIFEVSAVNKEAPTGIQIELDDTSFEEHSKVEKNNLVQLIEYPKLFGEEAIRVVDIKKLKITPVSQIASIEYPKQEKPIKIEAVENIQRAEGLDLLKNLTPQVDIQKSIAAQNPQLEVVIPKEVKKIEPPELAKVDTITSIRTIDFLPLKPRSITPKVVTQVAQQISPQASAQTSPQPISQASETSLASEQPTDTLLASNEKDAEYPNSGYSGTVTEAFSSGKKAVNEAVVQILGTPWTTKTDNNGNFSFDKVHVVGILPVIITKEGYLNRRLDLSGSGASTVELLSENSASLLGVAASEKFKLGSSFLFGQLASGLEKVEGFKVEVSNASGPINEKIVYFDETGIPNQDLTATSSNGQFMVLNLTSGTLVVNVKHKSGIERAPHLIHINDDEGLIRKFSLGEQFKVQGKLLNASNSQVIENAEIQLLGTTLKAQTGKNGEFDLGNIYMDCYDNNFLQIEKKGYYRNRTQYYCNTAKQNYYAFSSAYVDGAAIEAEQTLNPANGIVIGNTKFDQSVKMQLWGPNEISDDPNKVRGKDFYLEADGILNPEMNRSMKNGNFIIMDAPEGLSYLQAFDEKNNTLMYWPVYLGASTVNVFTQ